jgi:polar amino acid transport system substrate-binding protein
MKLLSGFSIFTFVFGCCLSLSPAFACDLKVRTYEFPPFAIKDQHGHWSGIDIDYTKVLLDESHCRYRFVELPWSRGMKQLQLGQIDMMLNVTQTPQRMSDYYFIGPQRDEVLLLVTKTGSVEKISQWSQMKTLKVNLMRQRGTFIGRRFEQLLTQNPILKQRLIYLSSNVVNIEMIRKGRAVGFFAEASFLKHEFEKNPDYAILEVHPIVINRTPVHYAFSKASMTDKQIKLITEAYHRLVKIGKLQIVEKQYDEY